MLAFLPALFMTEDAEEIKPDLPVTLTMFFATAAPLTVVTVWLLLSLQFENLTFYERLIWPIFVLLKLVNGKRKAQLYVFA